MEKIFDYRFKDEGGAGVKLIVRPNNTYGQAPEGATVLIDEADLLDASTRSACMTPAEAIEITRKLEAAAEADKLARESRAKVSIKAIVETGLAAISAHAERSVAEAKKRAEDDLIQAQAVSEERDAIDDAEKASSKLANIAAGYQKKRRGR